MKSYKIKLIANVQITKYADLKTPAAKLTKTDKLRHSLWITIDEVGNLISEVIFFVLLRNLIIIIIII